MTIKLKNSGLKIFTLFIKIWKLINSKGFFLRKQIVLIQENYQSCQYKLNTFKNIYISDKTLNHNGNFLNKIIRFATVIFHCGSKPRLSPYVCFFVFC